jgi:hypothetical protein
MRPIKAQFLTCWTEVDIALGLVAEAVGAEERGAVVHIRGRNIGMDVLPFDSDQVLFGAIFAVARERSLGYM